MFRNRVPAFSAEKVAIQTEARLERQEILHRPSPPTISFVAWEPVLMLQLLDDEGHAEQLRSLRTCAGLPARQLLRDTTRQPARLQPRRHQHPLPDMRCCEPRPSAPRPPWACWIVCWESNEHRT
ncbi:DUF5753 domain-containing protein [Streptomyces sp. NBC_01590]|uniref:Scr1 family TA system antitoxin-like transcriptional regulator n=1 Tax=Streptomyces sp. NBC_01590 TaxID=2975887 RepID=UPI00386EB2D3